MSIVRELLAKMSLEEKIAQLQAINIENLLEGRDFSEEKAIKFLKFGIGEVGRLRGDTLGLSPNEIRKIENKIQRFLLENTRLRIPAIMREECLAGVLVYSATSFPQAINLASTWDPELVSAVVSEIKYQARLIGVNQCYSPVLDVCRDPRWGRCEETFGEDPYLVALLGVSYVKALQGSNNLIATLKHFGAHGFPEGGRNISPVHVGERELREVFLFPFEAAIKKGNALSVMPAYNEIDGIPVHSNVELLTKILREEFGFDGIVVSDYSGIIQLHTIHRVASDRKEAAIKAIEAGVDIEYPAGECYGEPLLEAVKEGLVSISVIDRAVERVLRIKEKIGLFTNPYVDENNVPEKLDNPKARQLALEAARKSIVLLKNDNILPLKKDINTIAVIGPNADAARNMVGDYTYTGHLDRDGGIEIVTVLKGIMNKVSSNTKVLYAKGCDIATDSKEGFNEAIEIARKADVIIAVMGEKSGLPVSWIDLPKKEDFEKHQRVSGEGNDSHTLRLPGVQEELIKELYRTGKPIILVLINGRPLSLLPIMGYVKAIIEAWFPGEEGGNAIADVIFGDYNPSGRLPITFPMDVGQLPLYYNRKPSSFRNYVMFPSLPLFPFGYGLSYTEFRYSNLSVSPKEANPFETINISLEVENIGKMEGEDVVQLYISKRYSSVARPVKELKGFSRVSLKPGEKKRVSFRLPLEALAFYDIYRRLIVEPGEYEVMIGKSSEDIVLRDTFKILGNPRVITFRNTFFTESIIE
ncbi:MAG: glycoside hydrolase family 3 N-terminal domain-containing protein [Saccharolobus sp.]